MTTPKNYEIANSILRSRDSRKLRYETHLERRGENIVVRHHATDIVTYMPTGDIVLTTGGWMSRTTKDRLNDYSPAYVFSDKGLWILVYRDREYGYSDGITLHPDGTVSGSNQNQSSLRRLRARIVRYSQKFSAALVERKVPRPSMADCLFCSYYAIETGAPLGETVRDTEHLLSHIDEGYYVPSLLTRALKLHPISPIAQTVLAELWGYCAPDDVLSNDPGLLSLTRQQVCRSIRRYLLREFKLAA